MAHPVPLGPGRVCFWCNIARFGFMPLFIGVSSALMSFVMLFSVSLKPWFADGFFAYILLSAYIAYIAFGAYVFLGRASGVHVEAARTTLYLELAVQLYGRPLLAVMPSLREVDAVPTASPVSHQLPTPPLQPQQQQGGVGAFFLAASSLSPEEIRQKKGETAQLLSMDYLDQNFRKVLKQTLGRDEYVLWCEKPDVSSVISYDTWLYIDLTAGAALGVWMFVASTIKDPSYVLVRLLGPTTMGVLGFLLLVVFTCLLMTTMSSTTRLYALTDRRLLTVYNGVISPTVAETDLQSLRCASVYGYKVWNAEPVLTFSWEVPVTERKMPPIKSHNFAGVSDLEEFLRYFKAVAPPLPPKHEQNRQSMRHKRQVWRMHLFVSIMLLEFLPIITLYPLVVPGFLSLVLFLIIGSMMVATVHRGLRVQHVTHAPLSLAGNWAAVDARQGGRAKDIGRFFTTSGSSAALHQTRGADGANAAPGSASPSPNRHVRTPQATAPKG